MKMDHNSRNKDSEKTQKQILQTMQSDRFAARRDEARGGEQTYDGSRGEGAWSTGARQAPKPAKAAKAAAVRRSYYQPDQT
jgi:hypothetical protein